MWAGTLNLAHFGPPPEPPQIAPAASPGPRGPGKTIYVGCGADSVPTNSSAKGCGSPRLRGRGLPGGGGATRGASAPRVSAEGGPRRFSAARGALAPRVSALGQPARSLTALLPPFNSAGRGFCGFLSKSQSANWHFEPTVRRGGCRYLMPP